jgi:hypothetical protein
MTVCVYCEVDPDTLEPSNDASRQRLNSLRLTDFNFLNKSVLEVGTNSGLLGLALARKYGALVTGIEIQKPLAEKASNLAIKHGVCNFNVIEGDFMRLQFDREYDYVFFLEILHWAVYQGHTVKSVIEKISCVTREVAFLEFPWDIEEPAIVNQTDLTAERYSSYLIFKSLTECFKTVEVWGFQNYFGGQSRRAVVVCKK